jgi:hypothetical protein
MIFVYHEVMVLPITILESMRICGVVTLRLAQHRHVAFVPDAIGRMSASSPAAAA